MTLYSLRKYYPNSQPMLEDDQERLDLNDYSLYCENDQNIGCIKDVLVDNDGHFRYLVIDIASWGLNKRVLVPIGLVCLDYERNRASIEGFTRGQAEHLPEYSDDIVVDEAYENRVRDIYRSLACRRAGHRFIDQPYTTQDDRYQGAPSGYTPSPAYDYNREPIFYGMSSQENHQRLKQYEERLAAVINS